MKLLTFLGMGKYEETTYCWDGRCHTSRYCPAALAHFHRPETTLVAVTEGARAMHFDSLVEEIAAVSQVAPIAIPEGKSEAELWAIFDALTGQFAEGDRLIVDLTHGFRSLPFLGFLAVAYLRIAKKVHVTGVYYGAFEARNREANRTPVFDLTPFVALLDWTVAADRFERQGDASDLARLLRNEMPPGPLMGTDEQARALGKSLQRAAEAMETISLALSLNRPYESMAAAHALVEALAQHRATIESRSRPFTVLTDRIQEAYRPFALAVPREPANWRDSLAIQLDMIGWYLDKGHIIQAVTLAREWLVSALCYRFDLESMTAYEDNRQWVENALNNEVERHKPEPREPLSTPLDEALRALPQHRDLGKLWTRLGDLRNDVAHAAGKSVAADVQRKARAIYDELRPLGQELLNENRETLSDLQEGET